MKYLHLKQVLYLYQQLIAQSGGSLGLRDEGLLESAVHRPQASFGGHDLYPDLFSKTAALGHAVIHNHPFLDGNKRIGYEAMRLMLRLNGFDVHASVETAFGFVMGMTAGKLTEQAIADWLKRHSRPYRKH